MFGSGKTRSEIMPILVVVKAPDWNAFGPDTLRARYLYEVLRDMGGVSDSVEDGSYYFNEDLIDGNIIRTLYPIPE